jgi:hypothetical protein
MYSNVVSRNSLIGKIFNNENGLFLAHQVHFSTDKKTNFFEVKIGLERLSVYVTCHSIQIFFISGD